MSDTSVSKKPFKISEAIKPPRSRINLSDPKGEALFNLRNPRREDVERLQDEITVLKLDNLKYQEENSKLKDRIKVLHDNLAKQTTSYREW